jgi:hypothetical protein
MPSSARGICKVNGSAFDGDVIISSGYQRWRSHAPRNADPTESNFDGTDFSNAIGKYRLLAGYRKGLLSVWACGRGWGNVVSLHDCVR